jgi:FtsP/CotA-like multicopper oxidase with cupredoxin domain
MTSQFGRRDFLKFAGAAGALGGAALTPSLLMAGGRRSLAQEHTSHSGAAPAMQGTDWQEMDRHHQEGVDIFLAGIGSDPEFWLPSMPYTLDGSVKVFEIVCEEIEWDTGGGMVFPAMAYNGRVPGPEIRVNEGDRMRLVVRNEMNQSTAVHFHALRVPNAMDGVPMVTQPVITPGSEFTYEFDVINSGSHMYHSHYNAAEQVTRGLLGPLVVVPRDTSREPAADAEYNLVLNDSALGFTINGKGFPYTQPIIAQLGQRIRIRYYNEGLMIHPMHLHGIPQLVVAKDGFPLPMPFLCDTLNIAPGERYDVIVECDMPGVWAFHCHVLSHAEGPHGMFGMVTVLIVQE